MASLTSTEYSRRWREANKAQAKATERRRYQANHAEILEKKRLYRLKMYYEKHGADAPPIKTRVSTLKIPKEIVSEIPIVKEDCIVVQRVPVTLTFD